MLRRLRFFGFGFLLSILILSIGPNNRLKETFLAYVNYFNINKRVIFHLNKKDATIFSDKAICQMLYYNLNKEDLFSVLEDGKVNFNLSDKRAVPCQYFVICMLNKYTAIDVTNFHFIFSFIKFSYF